MPKTLIALVATAVLVGGERRVIAPGQPLPDLGERDAADLQRMKAARQSQTPEQPAAATSAPAADNAPAAAKAPARKKS